MAAFSQEEKVIHNLIACGNRMVKGEEVIGEKGTPWFVGYKAPTRFSELCLQYPLMIDSHMNGKYRIGRFRFEAMGEFMPTLTPRWQVLIGTWVEHSGALTAMNRQ